MSYICKKCKEEFNSKEVNYHHIFPVHLQINNKLEQEIIDNRTIILCKKHHVEIHRLISNLITKDEIEKVTSAWLEGVNYLGNEDYPICPQCRNKRMFLSMVGANDVELCCSDCGHTERSIEYFKYFLKKELKQNIQDVQQNYLKENYFEEKEEEDGESI